MSQYKNDDDSDHEITTHAKTMRPAGPPANDTDAPVATDLRFRNGTVPQPDGGSSNLAPATSIPLAHREDSPAELLVNVTDVQVNDVQPNGDDADARMAKIEEILDHAATPHLEKCELIGEWVRHAEAKFSISGQVDQKPGAGRPEGGIARAARELPLPGKSDDARRKFIQRAIDITCIWPEAKSAARKAKLDNIQSALLDIAGERSLAAQLAKVAEIAARKAAPRRKSRAPKGGGSPANAEAGVPQTGVIDATIPGIQGAGDVLPAASDQALSDLSDEEEGQLAGLKNLWAESHVLNHDDWLNASVAVRHRFVRDVLLEQPVSS